MAYRIRSSPWLVMFCLGLAFQQQAAADSFSILTLNLHGPHPTDQGDRYIEYPPGQLQLSWSNPFYYSQAELTSGQANRDRLLAKQLDQLSADLIFFQEVTAGDFLSTPSCDLFSRADIPLPNPVLKIKSYLPHYQSYLACRGNKGWWTTSDTFKNQRVFRGNQINPKNLVFDYNENPYPKGLVIEGLAILTSPKIKVIQHGEYSLKTNRYGDQFFFQWILFSVEQGKQSESKGSHNILALNLHQGHKLSNFEQNLMLQNWVMDQKSVLKALKLKETYSSLIIAGDLNETLAHSSRPTERLGLTPWLVNKDPEFDFSFPQKFPERITELKQRLKKWNQSVDKSWANINDPIQADARINDITDQWSKMNLGDESAMTSALISAQEENKCFPRKELWGVCQRPEMIDHIFYRGPIQLDQSSIIFNHHNWTATSGTFSDHPGLYSVFSIEE